GNEASGRRAIGQALELNQRGWFRAALGDLARRDIDLGDALGLPAMSRWPAPRDLRAIRVPERPELPELIDDGDEDHQDGDEHDDEIVFRLRRRVPWEQPSKFKWPPIILLGSWFAATIDGEPAWGIIGTMLAA